MSFLRGCNEAAAGREVVARLVPFLQHDYSGSNQVFCLAWSPRQTKSMAKARDDGYLIVTRDADLQELPLVWGQAPKVIRLKTLNQSGAATLKLLI